MQLSHTTNAQLCRLYKPVKVTGPEGQMKKKKNYALGGEFTGRARLGKGFLTYSQQEPVAARRNLANRETNSCRSPDFILCFKGPKQCFQTYHLMKLNADILKKLFKRAHWLQKHSETLSVGDILIGSLVYSS